MISAVIFDCFGVLVGRGFNETYRAAGGDPEADRDFITDLLGQTNLGLISETTFHRAMTAQLHISLSDWQAAIRQSELPNEPLLAYIEELHQHYKTAVLSNANIGIVDQKIGRQRIARCFDAVVVSAEVGFAKPSPEVYTITAEKLAVSPQQCFFLDDHEGYLTSARAVGMQTILYQDFSQATRDLDRLLEQSAVA